MELKKTDGKEEADTLFPTETLCKRSTIVAVSLRRDEPFGTTLGAIWPVIIHDAFISWHINNVFNEGELRFAYFDTLDAM